jgi:ASC-1-like (ASCH) protein
MDHVAIMKKSWGLTSKIVDGSKTIETRWYKNRSAPWDRVKKGDMIYFKDSGESVSVKATVSKVEQYSDLDDSQIRQILSKYGSRDLGTEEIPAEIRDYVYGKKYGIVIFLEDAEPVEPFEIDKAGFGAMSAWLCVDDINDIKIK